MIKEKNNMENSLLDKDEHNNTNNTNKIKNNIFFILCVLQKNIVNELVKFKPLKN